MTRTKILSAVYVVPERVVTNKDLADTFECSDDDLLQSTGVSERRYTAEEQGNVSMAAEATLQAAEVSGVAVSDIEMIICATSYPDHQFPGNSAFLQDKLGLNGCAILDVRNQGAGFLSALNVADQYIRTGTFKHILVVGSDVHSTGLDFSPEGIKITPHFGDGAGVFLLGPSEDDTGIQAIKLHTDARYVFDWYIPLGSIAHPRMVPENLENKQQFPVIHWDIINRVAIERIPEVILEIGKEVSLSPMQLDLILAPNQSEVMIRRLYKASGIPVEKFYSVKARFGNTGNAGLIIGLCEALKEKKLAEGQLVCMISYGSGFSWGAAIIKL